MATLVDSGTFAFADGGAGHVCDFGSAPTVGAWDVLCVNSDTVVSTPAGWSLLVSDVSNQGAYIYARQAAGGEGQTVTITTSGDHNTEVLWSRWSGVDAVDVTAHTMVDGSVGGSTPAVSTGTLASTGELVVALGAMSSIGAADQSAPTWSAGYTGLLASTIGSGTSGVLGYVGYRTDAGTAAETPSVSWSGGGAFNRYILAVAFTPGVVTVALSPAVLSLSGVAVDPVPGVVTVALSPATLALSAVALGVTPGAVSVSLTPAVLALAAVALSAGGRCVVTRPDTGTVTRPYSGVVTRP